MRLSTRLGRGGGRAGLGGLAEVCVTVDESPREEEGSEDEKEEKEDDNEVCRL